MNASLESEALDQLSAASRGSEKRGVISEADTPDPQDAERELALEAKTAAEILRP